MKSEQEAIKKSLQLIHNRSYHHRYKAQKNTTGLSRFTLTYSDGYRDTDVDKLLRLQTRRFYVKYTMIQHTNRNAFRLSKYNSGKIPLTYKDIAQNYTLFNRGFLIFLDGKLLENAYVVPHEDITTFHIDETLLHPDVEIVVIFTPNYRYGYLEVDYNRLNKAKGSLSLPDVVGPTFSSNETYLAFRKEVSNGMMSVSMGEPVPHIDTLKMDERVVVNTFGFRHLYDVKEVHDRFFQVKTTSPTPPENMLVFKETTNGLLLVNLTVTKYYPDVYEIIDGEEDTTYIIYIFYNSDFDPHFAAYDDEMRVLTTLLDYTIEDYKNNRVPDEIKLYEPSPMDYSIDEAVSLGLSGDVYNKMKLQEFTTKHPGVLSHFIAERQMPDDMLIIPLSPKVLSDKQRFTTLKEFDKYEAFYDFVVPHTLFIFKNHNLNNYLNVRFYVDGHIAIETFRWKKGIYEYYYIDESLLTDRTMVEVEFFNSFHYIKSTVISTINGVKKMSFPANHTFTVDDIFITVQGDDTFVARDDYEILENIDGKYVAIKPHTYQLIKDNEFYLRVPKAYVNTPLNVYVSRNAELIQHTIETTTMSNEFKFNKRYAAHKEQIRVFKNGAFLTPHLYTINLPDKFGGETTVHPGTMAYEKDSYVVDITPNHYHEVFHLSNIPVHGVVSLLGFIDKPLDFRWYDFYVNGRKLNERQIKFLSPTLLKLENLTSLKGFFVIEKNRVVESVVLDDQSVSVSDKFILDNPEILVKFSENSTNENSEEELIGELVDMRLLELERLLTHDYPPPHILFPETLVKEDWIGRYHNLFNGTTNLVLFPEGSDNPDSSFIMPLFAKL